MNFTPIKGYFVPPRGNMGIVTIKKIKVVQYNRVIPLLIDISKLNILYI